MSQSLQHSAAAHARKYRAPQQHGQLLTVPKLQSALEVGLANQSQLMNTRVSLLGTAFPEYRQQSREEILQVANHFTKSLTGSELAVDIDAPIFMTGHQPQFVHPGVWAKNLSVSLLAKEHSATGLNLVVDNDVVDLFGVQVPAGSREQPHFQTVLFDDPQLPQPWEEVRLKNREEFLSFSQRVRFVMQPWGIDSVLDALWPAAVQASSQCDCTILPLTAVRAKLERYFGLGNLEIPVSSLCETTSFLKFSAEIILRHDEFFKAYNEAVHWYRTTHGIRNDRHPVPDLVKIKDRVELPFWFWRAGDQQRERVFVQQANNQWKLFAGDEQIACLTTDEIVDQLQRLQRTGKLRTRALSTTIFSRIALADLFVHGIGGAKYDEITDRIISKFFQLPVPEFMTVTATLHLPLKPYSVTQPDRLELEKRLRDLHFNADKYLQGHQIEQLQERKQVLIEQHEAMQTTGLSKRERQKFRFQNRKRHLEFKEIQQQLKIAAENLIKQTEQQLELTKARLKSNRILRSREFAAVLYPIEVLQQLVDTLQRQLK